MALKHSNSVSFKLGVSIQFILSGTKNNKGCQAFSDALPYNDISTNISVETVWSHLSLPYQGSCC